MTVLDLWFKVAMFAIVWCAGGYIIGEIIERLEVHRWDDFK